MRILYLTPAWFGFDKLIYEGETEITGLPSFSYPLKGLVENGHEIDMLIIYTESTRKDLVIKSDWVLKINFVSFFKYELKLFRKIISIFKFRRLVKKLISTGNYDFVYVHGSSPSVANDLILRAGIPVGQRLYGTFLWDKIKSSSLKIVKYKHLVEYLSFRNKKSFLLATDDGSGADKVVHEIFNEEKPPYEFCYWKNGVSRLELTSDDFSSFSENKIINEPYIFYCARFDGWKRQDRILNILSLLSRSSIKIKVVFAGPFDTLGDEYYNFICEKAKSLGVYEQCVFLGSIKKKEIFLYNKYAVASLSLYDVCNVTSVFHEMMASGALIIAKNEPDVAAYIENGINGFLVDSDEQVVQILKDLLSEPTKYQNLRLSALETSNALTKNWESRVNDEIILIEKYTH